jgi:hypothetical protein
MICSQKLTGTSFLYLIGFVQEVRHQEVEGAEHGHVDEAINADNGVGRQHRVIELGRCWVLDARTDKVEGRFHAVQSVDVVQLGAHQHALKTRQGQEKQTHNGKTQRPFLSPAKLRSHVVIFSLNHADGVCVVHLGMPGT